MLNRRKSQVGEETNIKRMKESYQLGNVYGGDLDYLIKLSQLQPNFDAHDAADSENED